MIVFDFLIRAMRSTLDFYLGITAFAAGYGPLLALALLSLSVFVLMLPLYKFGDKLLAGEKKRKAQMQRELDSIAGLAKAFYQLGIATVKGSSSFLPSQFRGYFDIFPN